MDLLLCSDDDQDDQYDYQNREEGTKEDEHNPPILQIICVISDRWPCYSERLTLELEILTHFSTTKSAQDSTKFFKMIF